MIHKIDIESTESLVVLDSLKRTVDNPEYHEDDRTTARKIMNRIIDVVGDDLKKGEEDV